MSEQPKRRKLKRRVAAVGALVAGLVALVAWLAGLLPGMGLGTGGGGGIGTGKDVGHVEKSKTPEPKPKPKPKEKKPQPTPVFVDVEIDKDKLLLKTISDGQPRFETIELAEVIKRARSAKGNEQGRKVQVLVRATGYLSTRKSLVDALKKAGFEENKDFLVVEER